MNRRRFLKLAGAGSVAFAAGCSPESPKYLHSLVHAPDDQVTGSATWYASTCRECPAGCGILAKNREGRVVKIEGNPLHPINRGKLCMRGQAALQAVYHPDRLKTPLLKGPGGLAPIDYAQARALLKTKAREAARRGRDRVRLVTEAVGASLMALFHEALKSWNSGGPLVFEPFGYEALKSANRRIFGVEGLFSHRLEEADLILSFGADFLETWLSPVEYAAKFKKMHAVHELAKGTFLQVSPCCGLTGANADAWLPCAPGGEAAVALGLVRRLRDSDRGRALPAPWPELLEKAAGPYTPETAARASGIAPEALERLAGRLFGARRPLVLGPGAGAADANGYRAQLAAGLLNRLLDPALARIDAGRRHRVEIAARRSEVLEGFRRLGDGGCDLLILNNVNPVFTLPPASGVREALASPDVFVVSLTSFLDETAALADLVLPVALPLETWDDYAGWSTLEATLQPVMRSLNGSPMLGDVFLEAAFEAPSPAGDFKQYIATRLEREGRIREPADWLRLLQRGGLFEEPQAPPAPLPAFDPAELPLADLAAAPEPPAAGLSFAALPSIRLFDGRGANRPWLNEIPEPLTRVAWQSPVWVHPETAAASGLAGGDLVRVQSPWGSLEAPVCLTELVDPRVLAMAVGQGHAEYGRYARQIGANPLAIMPPAVHPACGGPSLSAAPVSLQPAGRRVALARTDGSRIQHGRALALSVTLGELRRGPAAAKPGLTMADFPLTLPLPEGYSPKRDFYPPHEHGGHRWGMVVDLDRCIGCGACAAACYAENNVGIVGERRIAEGREMAWMSIERYHDEARMERVVFLPMFCQHCDNAPCESVCPVYAPHHNSEGLNAQIYNRCIGTRFCSQNCPYKVRRFNWFDWEWPEPMNLQLNPEVTVRSKGVMEKCSFCIQRIKAARTRAKNEKRPIADGEIIPACAQTCPTDALVFGDLSDRRSGIRRRVDDPRAYQAMGYLNTKPAVIYLKKVRQET
jgi:molybdopterin-containing oxidoreductase family iron-sulfur binding subunit